MKDDEELSNPENNVMPSNEENLNQTSSDNNEDKKNAKQE